jgi:hypothetical protein
MQHLSSRRHFDNAALKRLEVILDRTFADLNIDDQSPFARASREFVATMLTLPDEQASPEAVSDLIAKKDRLFGTARTNVAATAGG